MSDPFGARAEKLAAVFGTPAFLLGMTVVVTAWIGLNVVPGVFHWDHYPFILLTLMLSLQASYAAPFILLADRRQSERDAAKDEKHEQVLAEIAAITQKLEDHFGLDDVVQ